jgi:hypothetical protein
MKRRKNSPKYQLYRSRSYAKSFKESWQTLLPNVDAVSVSLSPLAVLSGLTVALLFVTWRYSGALWMCLEGLLAFLVLSLLYSWTGVVVRKLLTDRMDADTRRISRMPWRGVFGLFPGEVLMPFYMSVFVGVVIGSLIYGTYLVAGISLWLLPLSVVVAFILLVPCIMSYYQVRQFGHPFAKALRSGLKLGTRYYASTLMMSLVCLLVLAVCASVCFLPLFILNMAVHASNVAVMFGDTGDLPTSVLVLHFFLTWLLVALSVLLSAWLWMMPFTHHVCSVKTKEEERKLAVGNS